MKSLFTSRSLKGFVGAWTGVRTFLLFWFSSALSSTWCLSSLDVRAFIYFMSESKCHILSTWSKNPSKVCWIWRWQHLQSCLVLLRMLGLLLPSCLWWSFPVLLSRMFTSPGTAQVEISRSRQWNHCWNNWVTYVNFSGCHHRCPEWSIKSRPLSSLAATYSLVKTLGLGRSSTWDVIDLDLCLIHLLAQPALPQQTLCGPEDEDSSCLDVIESFSRDNDYGTIRKV